MAFTAVESNNVQEMYVRNRDSLGTLERVETERDKSEATFDLERLTHNRVRLRSIRSRDRVLRHQDSRIRFDVLDDPEDEEAAKDSTFVLIGGLAGHGVSFRSTDLPDRYIRHRDFELFLEPAEDEQARQDATFVLADPFLQETSSTSVIH